MGDGKRAGEVCGRAAPPKDIGCVFHSLRTTETQRHGGFLITCMSRRLILDVRKAMKQTKIVSVSPCLRGLSGVWVVALICLTASPLAAQTNGIETDPIRCWWKTD